MEKQLNIDHYIDGYAIKNNNCIDNTLAAATGAFNRDYYFYYSFLYAIYNNWGMQNKNNSNFLDEKNIIMNQYGIKMDYLKINNQDELLHEIKRCIDEGNPVMVPVKYYHLFYYESFMVGNASHTILISGYFEKKRTLILRECQLGNETFRQIIKSDPFSKLRFREDIVVDIWEKSNKMFASEDNFFQNKLFRIYKSSENSIIDSYIKLADNFINIDVNNNNLISFIKKYNSYNNNINMIPWRNNFHGAIYILFDIFEKTYNILSLNKDIINEYEIFKDEYLNFRYNLLSRIHMDILRKVKYNESKINYICDSVINMDERLKELIINIKKAFDDTNKDANTELVNYAINSNVVADSEGISENGYLHTASNVKSGQWLSGEPDSWMSHDTDSIHWLEIDLKEEKLINKFIIRHSTHIVWVTKDYEIQCHNGDNQWHSLISIKNNNDIVTSHVVKPTLCRYIRIYITRPAEIGCKAMIYELEILGQKR